MLSDSIIEENTLKRRGNRVAITVRMPWYRALPLSSVSAVEFRIDGVQVPPETVTFTVEGRTYRLDELPFKTDDWWFVLDSAVLEGAKPNVPDAGSHEVQVAIGLYIPYLPKADGVRMIRDRDTKTMALQEAS
ncbi:C-glycoside deglycosidase beta subunit domain-containing protein [Naasia aerilata]|uniref:C-deglycosylation enzyme beta subunit n=1 Tax=Naasia aerilata TaxID=1162966 RepID=A0ABN6XMC0_9MICO|nr:DUF6379 domain-containing protein [Naasia aerilata]BDZ46122.1 hypothetical protein GCM10025866_20310 [Naasia aerilata]